MTPQHMHILVERCACAYSPYFCQNFWRQISVPKLSVDSK